MGRRKRTYYTYRMALAAALSGRGWGFHWLFAFRGARLIDEYGWGESDLQTKLQSG